MRPSPLAKMYRVRPCYPGITVWAPRAEPEVQGVVPWQQDVTFHDNQGNQWFYKKMFPFQISYWLTSCALGTLQSQTLRPRALFVSLITICNLPNKYTKNSLWGCYKNNKNTLQKIEEKRPCILEHMFQK
jgi:hypothetical protein